MPIFLILFNVLGAFATASVVGGGLTGGGGGSSSPSSQAQVLPTGTWNSSSPTAEELAKYQTSEYYGDSGMSTINAAEAYVMLEKNQKPVAGDGVVVAVSDTGVKFSHQELSGKGDGLNNLLPVGVSIDAADNHGTHVAGTIGAKRDGVAMHGVAFNSRILSIAVALGLSGGGFQDGLNSYDSFDYAVQNSGVAGGAKVVNASWGGSSSAGNPSFYFSELKANNSLAVIATGNDGASNPNYPAAYAGSVGFLGYIISVASVHPVSKSISTFSNLCGSVSNYCISAPGEAILSSVGISNGYSYSSGTSMAAPHVSGSAAVLFGAWPQLTAPQVSEILFKSADKSKNGFANGVDASGGYNQVSSTYGQGILDLYSAVQYAGPRYISSGTSAVGGSLNATSGYSLESTTLAINPIFGDAFTNIATSALSETIYYDAYGRDYKAFLVDNIAFNSTNNRSASNLSATNVVNNSLPLALNFSALAVDDYNRSSSSFVNSISRSLSDLGGSVNSQESSNSQDLAIGNSFTSNRDMIDSNKSKTLLRLNFSSFKDQDFKQASGSKFDLVNNSYDPRLQLGSASLALRHEFSFGNSTQKENNLFGKTAIGFASNLDEASNLRMDEVQDINSDQSNELQNGNLKGNNSHKISSFSAAISNYGFLSQNNIVANPYQSFFSQNSSGSYNQFQTTDQSRNFNNLSLYPSSYYSSLASQQAYSDTLNQMSQTRKFNQFFAKQNLFKDKVSTSFLYQSSFDNQTNYSSYSGTKQNQLLDFALTASPRKGSLMMFSYGQLDEFDNNMLNSRSLGAFASGDSGDSSVKTSYFKITSAYGIAPNLTITATMAEGKSQIPGNSQGIFREFSDVRTRSSQVSLNYNGENSFLKGIIGAAYSEPMRVYRGNVSYDTPIAIDQNLNIIRQSGTASLVPSGKQKDYEIFYSRNLKNTNILNANLRFNFLIQTEPNNIKTAETDYLGMMSLNLGW